MSNHHQPNRTIYETIHSLKKQLTIAVSNSNTQEIKNILNRLRKEVIPTEELIRTTKIGISVGKQRQNPDQEISKLAKLIVNEWKNGVKKEPNQSHPSTSNSTSNSTTNSNSNHTNLSQKSPINSSLKDIKSPPPINSLKSSIPSSSTSKRPSTSTSAATSNSTNLNSNLSNQTHNRIGPRSSKTETHLNFESLQDKVRDGSMKSVFDALIFDSDAPADLVYDRAKSIESEVNQTNDSNGYKNKMRSLIFNLKDKNNPGLREAVVSGEISSKRLCSMGPADMASEERKAQDRKLAEENLFKARGAGPQQAETDAFRCGRCGQRKCTYYQMQTRSADEPMTTFVTCVNCNNRWKFS
ncbi:transcription elongation factor S-II [Melampsora americana]|nr:transcription elongation factor S-II [Melampsora americana]